MPGKRFHFRTLAVSASLSFLGAVLAAAPQALAIQGATALAGASLQKEAMHLEAAGKWKEAADLYSKAADAFEKEKNTDANIKALEKSAEMFEKYALMLAKKTNGGQPAPAAKETPQPAADPGTAPRPNAAGTAPLPLENSSLVAKNKRGELVAAEKSGRPIVGVKLSRHDWDIHNPGIVVAPDGVIHVCFVEKHATTYKYAVYHRSSADGGKTWSEAKNLSEVNPDFLVGNCRIAADGANRVYVIWRTNGERTNISGTDPHAAQVCNDLVYRVLQNGQWSGKAIHVHPPVDPVKQDDGSASWFVSTDPTGKVHVLWVRLPDIKAHPEVAVRLGSNEQRSITVGMGLVQEAVLNGPDPGTPHDAFMGKITDDPDYHTPHLENYDVINGYVDAAGKPHFVGLVTKPSGSESGNRISLMENGVETPAIKLPGGAGTIWGYPPTLLADAKGQQHIIALYPEGEQPNVRDYLIGSDAEPAIIRAAKEVKGKLNGMQAFQGPGGRMVVIMEMNDTGKDTDDELYVSMSDGGKWSAPVNITNNTGHLESASHQTSSQSFVATEAYWLPGASAATFDRQGHLVLVHVSKKFGIVHSSAFGVGLGGGSTATPQLLFLRF